MGEGLDCGLIEKSMKDVLHFCKRGIQRLVSWTHRQLNTEGLDITVAGSDGFENRNIKLEHLSNIRYQSRTVRERVRKFPELESNDQGYFKGYFIWIIIKKVGIYGRLVCNTTSILELLALSRLRFFVIMSLCSSPILPPPSATLFCRDGHIFEPFMSLYRTSRLPPAQQVEDKHLAQRDSAER